MTAPTAPGWCEHCMASAAVRDGLCAECWYDAVFVYPSGGMCARCHSEPVDGPGDIYCHKLNIEFERSLDWLTDDRPYND